MFGLSRGMLTMAPGSSDASEAPLLERSETRTHALAVFLGLNYHFLMEFFIAGFMVFGLFAGLLQLNAAMRIKLFDWVVISSVLTGLIVSLMAVIRTRVKRVRDALASSRDDTDLSLLRANPKLKKTLSAMLGERTLFRLTAVVFFSWLTTVQFMFVYTHVHTYGNQAIEAVDRGLPNDHLPAFVHVRYVLALLWQVITSAIYLWKVLGSFYKYQSLHHLHIQRDA